MASDKLEVPVLSEIDTVMINSGFSRNLIINEDYTCKYNRDSINQVFNEQGIYSTFNDDVYPGVNTKYFYNPKNKLKDGKCHCDTDCPVKTKGNLRPGQCIPMTIFTFQSGEVLINSGKKLSHNHEVYEFTNKFLDDNHAKILSIIPAPHKV